MDQGIRDTRMSHAEKRFSKNTVQNTYPVNCPTINSMGEERFRGFLRNSFDYLSASPMIGSSEPIMATTSEIIAPSRILESPCRFTKLGARMRLRHGVPVPSEMKYQPS